MNQLGISTWSAPISYQFMRDLTDLTYGHLLNLPNLLKTNPYIFWHILADFWFYFTNKFILDTFLQWLKKLPQCLPILYRHTYYSIGLFMVAIFGFIFESFLMFGRKMIIKWNQKWNQKCYHEHSETQIFQKWSKNEFFMSGRYLLYSAC